MDKRTVLAFILIGLMLILFPYYQRLLVPPSKREPAGETIVPEKQVKPRFEEKEISIKGKEIPSQEERFIKVDTDLYTGVISTRGGTIKNWILKKYTKKDGSELDLIKDNIAGNLGIGFITFEGDTINLSKRLFEPVGIELNDTTPLDFDGFGKAELRLVCKIDKGKYVEKIMKFSKDAYPFEMDIKLVGLDGIIADRMYWVSWGCGLTSSENKLEKTEQLVLQIIRR